MNETFQKIVQLFGKDPEDRALLTSMLTKLVYEAQADERRAYHEMEH